MQRPALLLATMAASAAFALDPMHDVRYTLGPEILIPNEFTASGGFYTRFEEDLTLPFAIKVGLNEEWEIGSKLSLGTYDKLESVQGFLDVGAKYRFTSYSAFQADLMLGINNDKGGALALTYTRAQRYTRNFSMLFEGRTGFFEPVTGEDGWVKLSGSLYPQFQVGESVRFRVGAVSSGSLGNLSDDFMVDLLPQIEVGLPQGFNILAEVAVGILQDDNNDDTRLGMYVTTGI